MVNLLWFLNYIPKEWGGRYHTPDDPSERKSPSLIQSGKIPYEISIRAKVNCSAFIAFMIAGYLPMLIIVMIVPGCLTRNKSPPQMLMLLIFSYGIYCIYSNLRKALSNVYITRRKKKADGTYTYLVKAVGRAESLKKDSIDPKYAHMDWEKLSSPISEIEEEEKCLSITLQVEQIDSSMPWYAKNVTPNGSIVYFPLDNVLCGQDIKPGDIIKKHLYLEYFKKRKDGYIRGWYLAVDHGQQR